MLGSPKIDSIYNMENKVHIPPYWSKLNNKKVILLNSSIRDFLNEDNYLKDLRRNIENILEYDGFGLIWRPHPLFESTIKSMKKEKAEEYEAIKKFLSRHPKAIIDKSANLYPAIFFSDALITDSSSLIQLYIMTKKPVYILYRDPNIEEKSFLSSDFFSCYFETELEIGEYLEMIIEGRDPLGKKRYDNFRKSIANSDGTSGKQIHDCIVKEIERNTIYN